MKEAEVIMKSAELRLDYALRAFRREVYGDEAYHQDVFDEHLSDIMHRNDPPPKGPRPKLKRLWAWRKRILGR